MNPMRRCLALALGLIGCATTTGGDARAPVLASAETEVNAAAPPGSPGPCRMQNEAFAGITVVEYSYEDGRRTRALQRGPDGERQTLWSYDARGRRAQTVTIDGAEVRTRSFHYDGPLLVREDVHDADAGRIVEQHHRSYDDAGTLRERRETRWADGEWVQVDHHALHYDDAGRFVYELRTLTPLGAPKQVHSITVEVDARGRVVARRIDEGMDGSFERVALFEFDDAGRLITSTQMHDAAIETVARHTYDNRGRLVRTVVEDAKGTPRGTSTYDFSCWD